MGEEAKGYYYLQEILRTSVDGECHAAWSKVARSGGEGRAWSSILDIWILPFLAAILKKRIDKPSARCRHSPRGGLANG